MGDRRRSRELALQALFFLDVNDTDSEKGIDDFCILHEEELTDEVKPFFLDLVNGVMAGREVSRMPIVDRNIMRLAVFELMKRSDIPATVSINEAVEIGKKFGTRDSGPFINGVLDRIRTQENL